MNMQGTVDKIYQYLIPYGMNLLAAVIIFIVGKWLAHLAAKIAENILSRSHIDKTITSFVKNLAYFTILIFTVIAALNKVGVETSSFLALIGAAGLAVGLALQGSLSNFAAGVMMVIFRPFHVDDYIEAGGTEGTVKEIQIFNTVIETKDSKRVIVPNSKITGDKITIHPK